jgi:hypothetical protein
MGVIENKIAIISGGGGGTLKRSVLARVQLVLDRWGRIDILVTDENR